MSTKTTIKRIALVAVSALGLGVVTTIAPANAAAATITVDSASVTVVGSYTAGSKLGVAAYGITVKDNATTSVAANLSQGESITATVTAVPAAANGNTPVAGDLSFSASRTRDTVVLDTSTGGASGVIGWKTNNCTRSNSSATPTYIGKYCMAIVPTKDISGYGTYSVRFDLLDVNGNILSYSTVKYTWVATAAASGATLTIGTAGTVVAGETYSSSATKYLTATLTDANGGRVITTDTTSAATSAPALSGSLESSTGTVLNTLTAYDTDTAAADVDPSVAAGTDGIYRLHVVGAVSSSVSTTTASVVRVRYGLLNVTASLTALPTALADPAKSLRSVTGAGLYTTTETSTAGGAITYSAPLTTKSITVSYVVKNGSGTVLQNEPVTAYTTWSNINSGSVSPLSGADYATVYRSNSDGVVTFTITNSSPVAGSSAVISTSGAAANSYGDITINWAVPAVNATNSVVDAASFKATAASSVKFGITVKDQFNNVMSGVVLQPSFGSTDANYSATPRATVTTDANGYASITVTAGAAATSDTVTWTASGTSLGSSTATYVATLPVIATLTGAYNGDQSGTTYADLFSTTAIGASTALLINAALDYSGTIAVTGTSTTDAQVKFQVTAKDSAAAAVTGVPVTVTTTDGIWITDSCSGAAGKVVHTKVCYPATGGLVTVNAIATGTGVQTITFTAGSVSISQKVNVGNATTDARFVKLSADGGEVTVSVTDRFGNGVAGQNVQISTSVGTLGNGQKTTVFATDTAGKVVVVPQGSGDTTITAYLSDARDTGSSAGYVNTTLVDSTLAAGNRTATLAFAVSTAATSDSIDAANEATDAANAATDAANAAAEAADAATAAAQDAQAAVAELATKVASLIAGIKAQITTLTNLVIKIQKKVKA
jgi:predicted membrane protein